MSSTLPRLAAVVLAAGASRRMGRPKQLLPLGGQPLLQHVLAAASGSMVAETVLVLGHAADEIRAGLSVPARCRVVVNPEHAAGQSTSLACGLAAIAADAVAAVVLLGDQPGVTSALIDRVAGVFLAGDVAAVRPVWTTAGMVRPGHPVVLARRLWPALAALGGDQGARALFDAHPEWLREVAVPGTPPADIDDGEDYRRVLDAAGAASTGG
jgi:molybdenum cofactor cytidylyltransferase